MKRKLAVILAADAVAYSRLVAEDEEEALARLTSYRDVFNDFVARCGGRIFNTAGDAVLAEFSSAVDAVRCALDLQESIRTRNLAYRASRHMNFRIGITIGDVVERDGDLLGDGVNIASRLSGIAPSGGVCISRSVYESVANKLSVKFDDLGRKQLKNIPVPVHAYTICHDTGAAAARPPRAVPHIAVLAAGTVCLAAVGGYAASKFGPRWFEDAPLTTSTEVNDSTIAVAVEPDDVKTTPEVKTGSLTNNQLASRRDTTPTPTAPSTSDWATKEAIFKRQWRSCIEGEDAQAAATACEAVAGWEIHSNAERALVQRKLGQARRNLGDPDGAIGAYSESIRLEASAQTYNDRGIAYFDKKDWSKSIADYTEAIRLDDQLGEAFNNRAWTLVTAGRAASALDDANKAVQLLPDKAYAWDTRGHVHSALKNRSAAVRDFRKALELDPGIQSSRQALLRLGEKL